MEADFWHERWENKKIGFHEGEVNAFLAAYFHQLNLAKHSCIFLPLCGKTRDIAWLLQQGYRVLGAELSQIAVNELFSELSLTPNICQLGKLKHYQAENIDIYVGDIFELSKNELSEVDAIYDRAALVALPTSMRVAYSQHLMALTGCAPQLLITFQYEQSQIAGPPFSISEQAIKEYYTEFYQCNCLATKTLEGGLKGKVDADESVWLLTPLN